MYFWSSTTSWLPTSETKRRRGTGFGCSAFWVRLGGQALVMIGRWYSTINQSQVTLVQPNDPKNLCAESLYPRPHGIVNWIVTSICHRQVRLTALSFYSAISQFKTCYSCNICFVGFDAVKTNTGQHQRSTFPLLWTWGKYQVALAVLKQLRH